MKAFRTVIYLLLVSLFALPVQATDQDRDMIKILGQAKSGDHDAQFKLGYFYQSLGKSQEDMQTAIHWYKKAAASGHASAAFAMGLMYEHGQGVEKNHTTAINWYEKAAHIYAARDAGYLFKLAKDAVARILPDDIKLAQMDLAR